MKFFLRVLGTWFFALSLVLLVMDGTRTLATGTLVYTSLARLWAVILPASWHGADVQMAHWPAGLALAAHTALGWPGWAIGGGIGLILLLAGRPKRRRGYVDVA